MDIKTLEVDLSQKPKLKEKKKIEPKEKKKRVITTHSAWKFTDADLTDENQWKLLNEVHSTYTENEFSRIHRWIVSQIKGKIYGYLGQDAEKGEKIADPETAIKPNLSNILQKLVDSKIECFYCKGRVRILYEFVRDNKQWTLERINNKEGHHVDNVEIACLGCNLKRRTMFHERYVFTKQMSITKVV
jgi:hypothetical protein